MSTQSRLAGCRTRFCSVNNDESRVGGAAKPCFVLIVTGSVEDSRLSCLCIIDKCDSDTSCGFALPADGCDRKAGAISNSRVPSIVYLR